MSIGSASFGFFLRQQFDAHYYCSSIEQDIFDICSLASRMEMNRAEYIDNEEFFDYWNRHTALDIQLFYFEYRSVCDYVAKLIGICYKEIPKDHSKSLRTLISWVSNTK